MARKVFISILGTGRYTPCIYHKDSFRSTNTRFVQQAVMEHVGMNKWNADDCAYILLTERARKQNWDNRVDEATTETLSGLKQGIEEMNLPCRVEDVSICNGKDENEMWEIFQTLYALIQEQDELYIDLTHSFRYLPMLLLVFGNYAKFLKHIGIKYISYGNFEARLEKNGETCAPLVDLLPLSQLQDWTFASADYLKNGDAHQLQILCKETVSSMFQQKPGVEKSKALSNMNKFVRALEELTDTMRLCRGKMIQNSDKWGYLQKLGKQLNDAVIPPLSPLVAKIQESFAPFIPHEDVRNGYHAFVWCYDHQLYQQAITILLETMISHFALILGLNWQDKGDRILVSCAINVQNPNRGDKENETNDEEKVVEQEEDARQMQIKELADKLSDDEFFQKTAEMYWDLTALRNDINHSGLLDTAVKIERFGRTIQRYADFIKTII